MSRKQRRAHRADLSMRSSAAAASALPIAAPRRDVSGHGDERTRDFNVRALRVRAASFDEAARSVEAVLSTEQPVTVMDFQSWAAIDEVLVASGARFADQLPLLDSHNRYSVDDQLGSIRGITPGDGQVTGRLVFAAGDDRAERAMRKVQQGHLTDVSVGYRALAYTDIAAGQSGIVDGKTYTAGSRTLRVTTQWEIKEASLTPIGADPAAKVRDAAPPQTTIPTPAPVARAMNPLMESPSMNPKVRKYLESCGLRAEATEAEATAYLATLNDAQRAFAATLTDAPAAPAAAPAAPAPAAAPVNETMVLANERKRIKDITDHARNAGVSDALRDTCIAEGLDLGAAAVRFLAEVQGQRSPTPAGTSNPADAGAVAGFHAPAAIVRPGVDQVRNPSTLSASLMLRLGKDNLLINSKATEAVRSQQTQVAELADRHFRRMSLVDLCRHCLEMSGQRVPYNQEEMIRAATATASLSTVFSTSGNKMLMGAFDGVVDTTLGWTAEGSLPNFKTQDRFGLTKQSGLERLPRGATANQTTVGEVTESYKAYRYAKQCAIDEQDIVDDDLYALQTLLPDMGEACGRLRPDLVYSILLANAALNADSVTLFHASSHGGNLSSGALAVSTLQASMAIMLKQQENGVPLGLNPAFLIVPPDLVFTALQLCSSAILLSGSSTAIGNRNVVADWNMQVVSDQRLSTLGVTDPVTGTAYAGTATNYFLAAKSRRGIEVGYVNGQKTPKMRTFVLDKGQYGIGFDVCLDIGAKALGYQPLLKSTGA